VSDKPIHSLIVTSRIVTTGQLVSQTIHQHCFNWGGHTVSNQIRISWVMSWQGLGRKRMWSY